MLEGEKRQKEKSPDIFIYSQFNLLLKEDGFASNKFSFCNIPHGTHLHNKDKSLLYF
jgi:hypothetical protein